MYALIILLIAAMAVVWGFRRGFARQTPAIIGVAFGIICARLLAPGLHDVLYGAFPTAHGRVEEKFVYDSVSGGLVFFAVYMIFATVTSFIGKVLQRDDRSILDNISGSLFALFKYMLFTSIILNVLLALNLNSPLLKSARSDDGNIITEVMLISPSVLGGEDVEELSHEVQLEEAKKIS